MGRWGVMLSACLMAITIPSWAMSDAVAKVLSFYQEFEEKPAPVAPQGLPDPNEFPESTRHEFIGQGLESPYSAVRYMVIEQIHIERDTQHLALLENIAISDPDPSVRDVALVRLGYTDVERALNVHRKLVADKDDSVRRHALGLLASSNAAEDVQAIETALKSDHLFIRSAIVAARVNRGIPVTDQQRKIGWDCLRVDMAWMRKNPINATGYGWKFRSPYVRHEYFLNEIRGNAQRIFHKAGMPEDIPHLEEFARRADMERAEKGKKDPAYLKMPPGGNTYRQLANNIRFRHMAVGERLAFVKGKLQDGNPDTAFWAMTKACLVPGGEEQLEALSKDYSYPFYKAAASVKKRCRSKYAQEQ